jgi:endo-1,4-beta-xylanase
MSTEDERVSLRALAEARGFFVGTAVDMRALAGEPDYAETLRREFNMCVAENAYKQFAVWKGPDAYDFSDTDRLAAFARDNGMTLRGHTLVWHQAIPPWLREGGHAPDEVRDLLRAYIHAFVGRYRGLIAMWDVVNEAITDGPTPELRPDSFWFRALGPDYLRLAFEWAHEADPDARLYYNDYEIEGLVPKSDAVYALVRRLQSEGAPIHGVGFQGHLLGGWRATDAHRANVRRFADLGLEWQVTEADIRMQLDGEPPTEAQLADQAAGYADLARLCLDDPNCRGLVVWGFTDAHSWIPGFRPGWGAALPFDEAYRPKPAYHALHAALGGEG